MRNWLQLLALLFTLLGLVQNTVAIAPPAIMPQPVVIPIQIVPSGHIAIMAKINGKGPYRFVFDTGAPALVVSEKVGKEAGVLPSPFHRPFFTPLGNLGEYPVKSIDVGGARQAGLVADVWNHPTIDLLSKAYGPFEGLIGFPFFAHYRLTIDYKAQTMTLLPTHFQPEDTKMKMIRQLSASDEPAKILTPAKLLGIRVTKDAKDQAAGVMIIAVMSGGPAAAAGLKAGDRLLVLDGRWTDTVLDCYEAAAQIESPEAVKVVYQRSGKKMQIQLTIKPGI